MKHEHLRRTPRHAQRQHGFGASGRRIITYRLFGFKNQGAFPDADFTFDVPLQFGWADDPTFLVDDASRTLIAQLTGKIGIANISVTSIPILELLNVLEGALFSSRLDAPPLVQVTDVPVEQVTGGFFRFDSTKQD